MPLHWTIDHQARFVDVRADGAFTPADVKAYLDEIAGAGAMPYAKLFDISNVADSFALADLEALGRSIRQYAIDGYGPLGPLAIVVSDAGIHAQAARYADSAVSNRPLRIFRERAPAQAWLQERTGDRRR